MTTLHGQLLGPDNAAPIVSVAAAPMAEEVQANLRYSKVVQRIV
jgi:hypothetical protein